MGILERQTKRLTEHPSAKPGRFHRVQVLIPRLTGAGPGESIKARAKPAVLTQLQRKAERQAKAQRHGCFS